MEKINITAEEWLSSERFLNNTLPLLILVIGLVFFSLVFTLIYVESLRMKRRATVIFVLLIVLLSSYSFFGVRKAAVFSELMGYQSAAIRDRRKKVFTYSYFPKKLAMESDALKLQQLPFYTEVEAIDEDSITYLGKAEHVYYFKLKQNLYMLNRDSRHIEFQEGLATPVRKGFHYTLSDKTFETVGFYSEIGPIYTKILIPSSMEELEYEELDEKPHAFSF